MFTLHSPRFPEANEEKSLPQRVAPSVPTETSGRTEESGGGRWRRRQQRALLWRPRSSLPQILEAGLELLRRREAPCSARGSRGFAFFWRVFTSLEHVAVWEMGKLLFQSETPPGQLLFFSGPAPAELRQRLLRRSRLEARRTETLAKPSIA